VRTPPPALRAHRLVQCPGGAAVWLAPRRRCCSSGPAARSGTACAAAPRGEAGGSVRDEQSPGGRCMSLLGRRWASVAATAHAETRIHAPGPSWGLVQRPVRIGQGRRTFPGREVPRPRTGRRMDALGKCSSILRPAESFADAPEGRGHSCRMQRTEELLPRPVGEFALELANKEFGDRPEGLWERFRDPTKERE